MKVTTIVKVVIWFFLYLIIFNTSLAMISAPNTIEVIFGLLLFITAIIVTFKTECLTTIKFGKYDRKTDD